MLRFTGSQRVRHEYAIELNHLTGASALPLDVGYLFFAEIQRSPVNGSSAASCNFGVLAGDEHTSFTLPSCSPALSNSMKV